MAACHECDGDGYVECDDCEGTGELDLGETCEWCGGDGRVQCSMCDGEGVADEEFTDSIDLTDKETSNG